MSISFTSAYLELTDPKINHTVSSLFELVGKVSGAVKDATPVDTYLLYSDLMPNGEHTGGVVASIVSQSTGNIHDIGSSEVGRLLDRPEFHDSLKNAIAKEYFGTTLAKASDGEFTQIMAKYVELMNGKDISGNRISNTSIWDFASHSYVAEAEGNFRIISPNKLDDLSVFVQSELPALLDNPKITLIDGIQRTDLLALKNSHGLEAVKKLITANSLSHVIFTELSTSNISAYLDLTQDKLKDLAADITKQADMEKYIGSVDDVTRAYYVEGQKLIQEITHDSSGFGTVFKKALVPVTLTLGLSLMVHDANAAEQAGDHQGSVDIIMHWVAETEGALALGAVGATLAGLVIAVLGAAGAIISTPIAGAFVLAVGLAGGFYGEKGATELYVSLLKDRDHSGQIEVLDKLANLFLGADYTISTPLPVDLNGGHHFILDTTFSRETLVAKAQEDIAWRYALQELNPFVITNVSYDKHNVDGSLDLYDPATGQGSMTELYLQDRAAMLTWRMRYDTGMLDENDSPHTGVKPYNEQWDTSEVNGNWDFIDHSIHLPGGAPLTLAIDGTGLSVYDHQIVFGTKNADTLEGSGDSDHLYGMGGNDTLTGGKGNDYLEGGIGTDTYIFTTGDGIDTINDTDGNGVIKGDADTLAGGQKFAPNVWKSTDAEHKYTYTWLNANPDGTRPLIITMKGSPDDQILIKHFHNGDLGITLDNADLTTTAPTQVLIGSSDPAYSDNLTGNSSYDWLLQGLAGNDRLTTGGGNDVLEGDGGSDILSSGGGDDTLYADSQADQATIYDSDTVPAGNTHDWLAGNEGNDQLFGSDGSDGLSGGDGSDLLVGGAGDDYIFGDLDAVVRNANWTAIPQGNNILIDQISFRNGYVEANVSRNDFIFAGGGNDHVWADLGDDYVFGGAGADKLQGSLGNDTMMGDAGDDILLGDDEEYPNMPDNQYGKDYLDGGADNDSLLGGGQDDTLLGGSGNDKLWGDREVSLLNPSYHGSDRLEGGIGDDTLLGNGGKDFLYGGEGRDNLSGDATDVPVEFQLADYLDGGDNNDTLYGYGGNDTLLGGDGSDRLYGDAGDDYLDGGSGDDNGVNACVLFGNEGNDTILGGGGSDELQGGIGDDSLDGGTENDLLFGGDDNDTVFGGDGNDELQGNEGNDTLLGGEGNDDLFGGAGSDTYIINLGDGNDVIYDELDSGSNNSLQFGSGISSNMLTLSVDTNSLVLRLNNSQEVRIFGFDRDNPYSTVSASISNFQFADSTELSYQDMLDKGVDIIGSNFDDIINGTVLTDRINALYGNDAVYGKDGNDTIDLGAGNDYAEGGAGADTLIGGSGIDTLIGGSGSDVYQVDNSADVCIDVINANDYWSSDRVYSAVNYDLPINIEDLFLTQQAFSGTGNESNNSLVGNETNNLLQGLAGRDNLDGGVGNDTLIGGLGDDRYNVDSPLDVVIEKAGEGTDSVKASSDYTLPDQVENLELEGPFWKYPLAASLNGTGNDLNNDLIGNGSHNYLQGLDGNDTIDGGTGNDTIDGGKGNDDIYGGYDDFYFEEDEQGNMVAKTDWGNAIAGYGSAGEITIAVFGFNDDIINGQEGDDTINGGPGSDMLYGGSGNDLLCGGENSIYTNFTILTNDNTLDGGEGNDILVGGTGDDRFIFGLGYGSDTIHYYMDYGTTDYDEVWLTDGITLKDITFSYDNYDLIVGLKNTTDQLQLFEWDGSFIKALHFSDGSVFDTTLIEQMINNTPPIVSQPIAAQNKQSGQNFVFAIPNETFTDVDQNDVLTLSAQLSNGQPLPSWLSFDSLNNTLTGTPQTNEAGLFQIEVTATDSYGASTNSVFALTIASHSNPPPSTQGQTILGTSADDTLSGGAGNDSVKGGDGNDSLIAGLGNDFLNGSTGFDTVDYSYTTANLNITLDSSGWATVNIAVDDIDTLAAIENLTGGAGNDTFIGNSLANVLKGNGGDDILNGGKGKDVLSGGQGADKFVFEILYNGDLNKDMITDFNAAEGDKIQLPKSVFTAFSSLNAVANINLLMGSAALDNNDFLIYNPATGLLSYDADGVGSVHANIAPLELAMLGVDSHPATLAANDFILV